jgi:hypothetical protein
VLLYQFDKAIPLTPVEPDNGGEVGELFRAEIVNLTGDFAVDVAGIEHQYLIAALFRLPLIKVPEFAGHGAGVKEVGANRDHHIDVAGLNQLAPYLGLAVPGTGGL